MEPGDVYGHHSESDEWEEWPYRQSLWTGDGRLAGIVSSSDQYYNVIQYPDILDTYASGIRQRQEDTDFEISGSTEIAPDYHKMSTRVNFDGEPEVEVGEGDVIQLGNRVRSGHSGYHGVKIDVGGLREVCSNGMMGWVADTTYEQTHQEPFRPEIVFNGIDAVIDGTEVVQQRLEDAQREELRGGKDEARLLLHELIEPYLENPRGDIALSIEEEVDGADATLYEAYNAGTRALSHHARQDIPQYDLDEAYDQLSQLLDQAGSLPDAEEYGRRTVENRAYRLTEDQGVEEHWEGETQDVRELLETHGIEA